MVVGTDRKTACCFTGHRKIPTDAIGGIRKRLQREIERLYTENAITVFYAGGATGFDALASEAVIERRAVHPDIRLVIVMPHKGQAKRWNAEEKARHEHIKISADEVICLTQDTGGTAYTVRYARKQGLSVINLAEAQRKCVSP